MKTKTIFKSLALAFLMLLSSHYFAQNVGINATGATPNLSAMLDIVSSSSGLLIPRLALTSNTDATTISGGNVTSLLVYNTATASTGTLSLAVYPGYYYWNGAKWVGFTGTGSNDWSLTGNGGTTVGTNFLGTTDPTDLMFKVNNVQAGLLDNTNQQTFFGYDAGVATTSSGNLTTFIGHSAGSTNTSGNANTAVGFGSLKNNNNANDNTAIGVDALYYLNAAGNTGVGSHALEGGGTVASNTGTYNTAIGYAAGSGYNGTPNNLPFTTGSYNTFLGYNSTITPGTLSNITAIGANAQVTQANSIVLGGISGINTATVNTNVGIGTTAPAQSLDIFSKFQVNSSGDAVKIKNVTYSWPGSQGAASTVLSNDGSGNLSWSTVSSLLNGVVTQTVSAASSSMSSTTYATKVSLAVSAGIYIIFFSCELESDNYDAGGFDYKFTDGTTVFANGSGSSGATNYGSISYIASAVYAGAATISLQYNSSVAGKTVRIQNARIITLRIN